MTMEPRRLTPEDLEAFMRENGIKGEVVRLETPTPTVETAAEAVGVEPEAIVKSILFLVNEQQPVLVIASGKALIDRRAVANTFGVGKKKVRLAGAEAVVEISGYEVGAMPPFGHCRPLQTLMDTSVLAKKTVYAGGGAENALLRIEAREIERATRASIIPVQAESTQ